MNTSFLRHSEDVNVADAERLASMIGGGVLLAYGIGKRDWPGAALAVVGGMLAYRGFTGHCQMYEALGIHTANRRPGGVPYELGIRVDKAVTINRPASELYEFWRKLENLPQFMKNLEAVQQIDDKHSHWVAKGPAGKTVEWDAEIINEIPGQLIGWCSLPGAQVDSGGSVRFESATGGRGTVVRISLQYNPPGGSVGNAFSKLLGADPAARIEEDLRRFKQLMETGEFPTTEGQPQGENVGRVKAPDAAARRYERIWSQDAVTEASEESFPASDAPSWTPERL